MSKNLCSRQSRVNGLLLLFREESNQQPKNHHCRLRRVDSLVIKRESDLGLCNVQFVGAAGALRTDRTTTRRWFQAINLIGMIMKLLVTLLLLLFLHLGILWGWVRSWEMEPPEPKNRLIVMRTDFQEIPVLNGSTEKYPYITDFVTTPAPSSLLFRASSSRLLSPH